MLRTVRSIVCAILLTSLAAPAAAAPAMFEASFIFHAWGNDTSSGTRSPYSSNDWTALPLGYNCQHANEFTINGAPSPLWCSNPKMQRGHPATAMWSRSIGTGSPPAIALQQSAFGVHLITDVDKKAPPYPGTTPQCCRGFLITFPPYLQTFTYATFANAAGSFFAGGGAAAAKGYVNKTGMTGVNRGTWRIRAGANAFGGAMGLLGKYGATGHFTITGKTGTYRGASSWNMVKALGRSAADPMNPYTNTAMWYKTTPRGKVKVSTFLNIGSGTLWTTGQVGNFARTGAYTTSLWRTGYDNRNASGIGTIQLVTPTLTHWLRAGYNTHTAQVGLLTIRVPEPGVTLLFAAGAGALLWLRRIGGRR